MSCTKGCMCTYQYEGFTEGSMSAKLNPDRHPVSSTDKVDA